VQSTNIQWITQDKTLFELDWLFEIVTQGKGPAFNIVHDLDEFRTDANTLIICNHAVNFRKALDALRQKGKKYGIFLLSDENLQDPMEYVHDPACQFIIRNYVNPMAIFNPKISTIGLGYKRNFVKNLKKVEFLERPYTWSFMGTPHGERKEMIKEFEHFTDYKVHYTDGFGASNSLSTEEYADVLSKTKFALCPPGQDSLDTFRIYEALEAGCIPVTLRRTPRVPIHPSYWNAVFRETEFIPFVLGDSWVECAKQVEQHRRAETEQNEAKNCVFFWNQYKSLWKELVKKKVSSLSALSYLH